MGYIDIYSEYSFYLDSISYTVYGLYQLYPTDDPFGSRNFRDGSWDQWADWEATP